MKQFVLSLAAVLAVAFSCSAQCTANFSYSTNGPDTLNFINLSTGTDGTTTYSWTFGDGGTSNSPNPTHSFSGFNTYVVCLTITTPDLSCTNEHCDTIQIQCPVSDTFTYLNPTQYDFDFTSHASSFDPITYAWTFGDGGTSATQDPTHTYAHTGIYDVCLRATDATYHCTVVSCTEISVCTAQAHFTYTNPGGTTYNFTDNSAGEDASTIYHWDFGDGDTSATRNPSHTFSIPGDHNVCLTVDVRDSNCINQFCTLISVGCLDSAKFSYTNTGGLTYSFNNLSTGLDSTSTYSWSFGDGASSGDKNPVHSYTQTGTMIVCLTVDNVDQGCVNVGCQDVTVTCNISAGFTYTNAGETYSFTDASTGEDGSVTYSWNFGDGGTSSSKNPQHTFTTSGGYNICLTILDADNGCTSQHCEHVLVNSAGCPASAGFTYTNTADNYSFTNTTTGADASTTYSWDFGDGGSSTASSPSHTFTQPGNYDVCLTVTVVDSSCSSHYCSTISIGCSDSANFSYTNTGGLTYNFNDLSTGVNDSTVYSWSFGDGHTSSQHNPIHTYTQTGTMIVCLEITDTARNCHSTHCMDVTLTCNIAAGFSFTNTGGAYNFTDASFAEDGSTTYSWNFGDGGTSTQQNPSHTYTSTGNYNVCLTINDVDINCTNQHCSSILVNLGGCPDSAHFTFNGSNTTYNFQDASTGEGSSINYYWQFGDGDTSALKNPSHTYLTAGDYEVCLTLNDITNSCSKQFCDTLKVVSSIANVNSAAGDLKLYPNPANDRFFVDWAGREIQGITIFNSLGEIVWQQNSINATKPMVDISLFTTGIYFVKITSAADVANTRVVVEKK